MSYLGTILAMFTAVHAITALFYLVHAAQRPSEPEHRPLAWLLFCAALSSVGTIIRTEALDLETGTSGLLLRIGATMLALPLLVQFQQGLLRTRQARILWAARVTGACGLFVVMAAARRGPHPPLHTVWGFAWAPTYVQPSISQPLNISLLACMVFGYGLAGYSLSRLLPRARREAPIRVILLTMVGALLASLHDLVVRLTGGRMFYLLDLLAFFVTIAASRMMLTRFVESHEQLSQRARQREQTRLALAQTERELLEKKRLAAIGELAAVIAHEVRNPLAIIKNAVSGLRRTSMGSDADIELRTILQEETYRLHHLAKNLLNYAQPLSPRLQPLDTTQLLRSAVARAQAGMPRSKVVHVVIEPADLDRYILGDADLLRVAFANVIENALHATAHEGRVTIAIDLDGDLVRVSVSDDGPGMASETLAKAVDPFFTTRPTGTGLGLAIVDRVIAAHAGKLTITSAVGQGTQVAMRLPSTAAAPAESVDVSALTHVTSSGQKRLRRA